MRPPPVFKQSLGWDFRKSILIQDKNLVGVDISKNILDVYRPDITEVFQIGNSEAAIAELCFARYVP